MPQERAPRGKAVKVANPTYDEVVDYGEGTVQEADADTAEQETDTRVVDMGGYSVTVQAPNALQLAMVIRILNRVQAKKDPTGAELIDAVSKACTVLESMIVDQADRDRVVDSVLARELTLEGLVKVLQVFQEDKQAKVPATLKKRVQRGKAR